MALLVAGAIVGGTAQIVLWTAAAAIDYAGPAWLTRERLRGLQHVAVAHFAERYSLFIIICLGESIVAIGVGASEEAFDAKLVAGVTLGLLITVALWWTYFDRFATVAEERLRTHHDPVHGGGPGRASIRPSHRRPGAGRARAAARRPARLEATGKAARASGHADADERLARLVLDLVGAPVGPVG